MRARNRFALWGSTVALLTGCGVAKEDVKSREESFGAVKQEVRDEPKADEDEFVPLPGGGTCQRV